MAKFVLIGGGARSGKSAFAFHYAKSLGARRVFLATAQAFDDEMASRIKRHQEERQGSFHTLEEPLDIARAVAKTDADVILIDCLTLWLSNLLLRGDDEAAVRAEVQNLVRSVSQRPRHTNVIIVSNEVGLGLVPETPLGRVFRDVAGWAHQALAAAADEVFFAAMGMVIRLAPGPVEALRPGQMPA